MYGWFAKRSLAVLACERDAPIASLLAACFLFFLTSTHAPLLASKKLTTPFPEVAINFPEGDSSADLTSRSGLEIEYCSVKSRLEYACTLHSALVARRSEWLESTHTPVSSEEVMFNFTSLLARVGNSLASTEVRQSVAAFAFHSVPITHNVPASPTRTKLASPLHAKSFALNDSARSATSLF